MLIYFSCLLIVTCAATLAQKPGNGRDVSWLLIFLAFTTMVLVAGFRDEYVGTDTRAYTIAFRQQATFYDAIKESSNELGYLALQTAARAVSDDYWVLLTAIAVVAVFCYMRSIYELSVIPAVAFFVFITMGYYTFFFNGARQGIACAIYTLALGSLINGNFKKYAFWVMIAFCFHKSVIIALPLYFLFRQKNTLLFVIQMVVSATIAVFFFGSFLDFGALLSDKYSVYKEIGTTGGRLLTLFYLLLCVFFIYYRSAISTCDRIAYDYFLNMLIFGSTIYIVVTFSGGYTEITRVAIYFQIALIFLWPILLRNIRESKIRFLFEITFLLGHIGYFYIFTTKMAGLVPYEINKNTFFQWLL